MDRNKMKDRVKVLQVIAPHAQGGIVDSLERNRSQAILPIICIRPLDPTAPLANATTITSPPALSSGSRPIANPVWKWSGFGLEMRQNMPRPMLRRVQRPKILPTAPP
jgi:hypothetical protein